MAVFRAHQRFAENLSELQIETHLTERTGMFLALDESSGENDENSPMLGPPNVRGLTAILRPSPRLPLQNITHLFQSNGLGRANNTRNVGVTDRVRRRPLESPVPSKKRRINEATSPVWESSSRPAFKSARPSIGLRSFR